MRGIILAAAVDLTLAACKTIAEQHHAQCLGYGFTQGTDGYATCRMNLDQNRKTRIAQALGDAAAESKRKNDEFHKKASVHTGAGGLHTYSVDGRMVTCSTFGMMTTCR